MSDQTSDDASEIEDLAAKIWTPAPDSSSVVANLTQEFPTLGQILQILEGFRENLEAVTSNKEELSFLVHRYTYITAAVITKCRRAGVQLDVGPLLGQASEVGRLIERCGWRSRVQGVIKREADRLEISDMKGRMERLPSDMGLVDIAEVETKHDEPLEQIPNRSQVGYLVSTCRTILIDALQVNYSTEIVFFWPTFSLSALRLLPSKRQYPREFEVFAYKPQLEYLNLTQQLLLI